MKAVKHLGVESKKRTNQSVLNAILHEMNQATAINSPGCSLFQENGHEISG